MWCRWVLPNYYYTTTREIPVTGQTLQLVAIDTVILDEAYARNMLLEKIEGGVLGSTVLAEFDARAHVRAHAAVEQLDWLEETLASSTADWLVVMGHYPVYSG
jgi:tartrate-resistant acid phosphatase type 5